MGVILLFLGVVLAITVHVLTHRRMDTKKKKLYVVSLIFAIICSFISTTGENKGDFLYFGVPAETFVYYGGWEISFHPLGFFLNFILFYWVLKLLLKLGKSSGREVKK
ncbi:group-specific protein [Bacillus cereus]|nr:group-specific protein [Bacillus cereus]